MCGVGGDVHTTVITAFAASMIRQKQEVRLGSQLSVMCTLLAAYWGATSKREWFVCCAGDIHVKVY